MLAYDKFMNQNISLLNKNIKKNELGNQLYSISERIQAIKLLMDSVQT